MTIRTTAALCSALLCVAAAQAQAPSESTTGIPTAPVGESAAPRVEAFGPSNGTTLYASGGQFWASADYLLAWIRGENVQAQVTTSPAGTDRAIAGVLGAPTTQTVFNGQVNDSLRSGFRLGAGYWFDAERTFGVEAGFMMLESQSTFFSAASDGGTILARPFTNALLQTPQAVLVAFPGSSSGTVDLQLSSHSFYEGHIDLAENFFSNGAVRLDSLLGYRFYRYDGALRSRQTVAPTGPNFVPGTSIVSVDDFGVRNEFHGLDLGARARIGWEPLTVELLAKVAVGNVQRWVNIQGGQVTTVPGAAPAAAAGGVYALTSNIASNHTNDWTAVPELGFQVSWQVSPYLRLRLGYSALLLTQIARPSEQVDFTLNPNLFPPANPTAGDPVRPVFQQNRNDAWVQSINLGLEFSY